MELPRPQELYRHFKGNLYQVITLATDSETGDSCVVYQALYGDYKVYVRPLTMFMSPVDTLKYPNADQVMRFERVSPGQQLQPVKEAAMPGAVKETASETTKESHLENEMNAELVTAAGILHKDNPSWDMKPNLDPMLEKFLDADTYEEKMQILTGVSHRITDDMITTMAIACDLEVPEGETQSRLDNLRSALATLVKYECNRLR